MTVIEKDETEPCLTYFPWVFLSAQGLLLIEELPGQCTGLAGQGQEQEPAPGIFCSRMKNLVQISQKQGQACVPFLPQNCSSSASSVKKTNEPSLNWGLRERMEMTPLPSLISPIRLFFSQMFMLIRAGK